MEQILELVIAENATGELFSLQEEGFSLEFVTEGLHSLERSERSGRALRVIHDGQLGGAACFGPVTDRELLDTALSLSRDGRHCQLTFPPPVASTANEGCIDYCRSDLAAFDVDGAVAFGEHCLRRIRDFDADLGLSIQLSATTCHLSVENSAGLTRSFRRNGLSAFIVVNKMSKQSSFRWYRLLRRPLAPAALDSFLDDFIDDLRLCTSPRPPLKGTFPIILSPNGMDSLLHLLESGVNASAARSGSSSLVGRQGDSVLASTVSITDAPDWEDGENHVPFDDEGVTARATPLFEQGVFRHFLNNRELALANDEAPTGNGFRIGWQDGFRDLKENPQIHASNIVFDAGTEDLDTLVASISRGLWVEAIPGAMNGNPSSGDFASGLFMAFLIENGKRVGRVEGQSLAGNLYDWLSEGRVVPSTERSVPTGGGGNLFVPHMLVKDVSLT